MTSPLCREARSRRVDQDPAHHLRCHGKEVRTVLPVSPLDIYQPQERLVDESRAFERVARAFVPDVPPGRATQVIVNTGNQPLQSVGIARAPCPQQASDLSGHLRRHRCPPKILHRYCSFLSAFPLTHARTQSGADLHSAFPVFFRRRDMIARLCITLNLLLCCCLYGQGNAVTDWATIVQPAVNTP